MANHARLRQGERCEDTDRVQPNEAVGRALEGHAKSDRDEGQGDDPGVEREPLASQGELSREEAVAGQDGRQAREVGEARVGGKDENAHGRELEDVVEDPWAAENGPPDLRQHAFAAAATARRMRADVEGQVASAQEHDPEQGGHDDHGLLRVLPLHRLEGRHAVGHGLGSRHGRAAVGEGLAQKEDAHGLGANAGQRRDILDLGQVSGH